MKKEAAEKLKNDLLKKEDVISQITKRILENKEKIAKKEEEVLNFTQSSHFINLLFQLSKLPKNKGLSFKHIIQDYSIPKKDLLLFLELVKFSKEGGRFYSETFNFDLISQGIFIASESSIKKVQSSSLQVEITFIEKTENCYIKVLEGDQRIHKIHTILKEQLFQLDSIERVNGETEEILTGDNEEFQIYCQKLLKENYFNP